MHFMLLSQNGSLLRLVREFAEGLGWTLESSAPSAITLVQPQQTNGLDHLLNLLTYVALAAGKTGVDPGEPLCRIRYRQGQALSEVTLGLRITEFDLGATS